MAVRRFYSYLIVVVCGGTARRIERGSASPVHGQVQKPRLVSGRRSTRSKLHHPPLQAQDDQRRNHSVRTSSALNQPLIQSMHSSARNRQPTVAAERFNGQLFILFVFVYWRG